MRQHVVLIDFGMNKVEVGLVFVLTVSFLTDYVDAGGVFVGESVAILAQKSGNSAV